MTNCVFINSNINDVRFINCKFDFKNFIYERELIGKFINDKNNNDNLISIEELITSYRQFEINLDKNKEYELAGGFHERRFELGYIITKKFSLKKILLFLYKWSSNYGENYARSMSLFIFFLILFSIIYLFFTGLIYKNSNDSTIYFLKSENRYIWNDIGNSFLYSLNNALPFRRELEFVKSANG